MDEPQVFADWLTQTVRLPAGGGHPELEMTVGLGVDIITPRCIFI